MATIQAKAPDPPQGRSGGGGARPWAPGLNDVLIAAVVLAVLTRRLRRRFQYLESAQWEGDPNYSYGFFVVPIAAAIFWSRRSLLDPAKLRPAVALGVPAARRRSVRLRCPPASYEWNEQFVETATIPLVAASLALALGGWPLLRVAWPALVFLLFMAMSAAAEPQHQLLARPAAPAAGDARQRKRCLQMLQDPPVMAGGQRDHHQVRRCWRWARACANGLSMLLSFSRGTADRGGRDPGAAAGLGAGHPGCSAAVPIAAGEQHPPDRGDGRLLPQVPGQEAGREDACTTSPAG